MDAQTSPKKRQRESSPSNKPPEKSTVRRPSLSPSKAQQFLKSDEESQTAIDLQTIATIDDDVLQPTEFALPQKPIPENTTSSDIASQVFQDSPFLLHINADVENETTEKPFSFVTDVTQLLVQSNVDASQTFTDSPFVFKSTAPTQLTYTQTIQNSPFVWKPDSPVHPHEFVKPSQRAPKPTSKSQPSQLVNVLSQTFFTDSPFILASTTHTSPIISTSTPQDSLVHKASQTYQSPTIEEGL
jgi:hypothetical protein